MGTVVRVSIILRKEVVAGRTRDASPETDHVQKLDHSCL